MLRMIWRGGNIYIYVVVCILMQNSSPVEADQDLGVQEFCETESFNATCGPQEVILMTHARYGRMRMSRCVKLDYGHMGCASDVMGLADGRCSGRHQCEIRIPDAEFATTLPCPDDLKPYLEAGFRCIPVESPENEKCTVRDLEVAQTEGYLSNIVTQETGCGGLHTPWHITVPEGQVISVRLLDFTVYKRLRDIYTDTQCQIYGEIRERLPAGTKTLPVTTCANKTRDSVVYVSSTNRIDISFTTNEPDINNEMPHYLFKYEAKGCPNKVLPPGSRGFRLKDTLVVKCNHTKEEFPLKCVGNVWVGELRNCSKISGHDKIEQPSFEDLGIPYGLSILIVLAIALVIGLLVLFIGLVFLKKQRGLCLRGRRGSMSNPAAQEEIYEKQYVRSPWIQTREDGTGSISSVTPKQAPWRDGTYGHAPSLVSDLPPCTPLVDRGHRPPSYGQVPGPRPRLACGCFIDGNPHGPGDLCDYPSRHEILATGCSVSCSTGTACSPAPARNTNTADRLILKPGDHAQYFVVDHSTPIYTVRSDMNNPQLNQTLKKDPPNNNRIGQGHMQTDDIKLKLKVTDKPSCAYTSSCTEECDKNDQCPESRPLIESPQRQSPRRQSPFKQSPIRQSPKKPTLETFQILCKGSKDKKDDV